ncbi:putative mitochondrial 37S ribosomal protein [Clavispora lusitaniae]|uniref:Mitochondrial 37S ribosomal protein n=3 Tax=Clavispora lusitaniae TaxID=36911 RepID=A0ACD0WQY1_CLALS|nr:hypothetical protein E0198_004942 [Clavispora lusitaniae]OVF06930.1 putative mitochondrial 37S ribosomal protein [Clavispora lusitaniae]QFZ29973.1 putative mitochondrial 37S ribosomal protein [Clavispora lusitaniae]QFZ35637.1 putative mitochondrial 37S ribosomal protein [Clavispora lusitaniae]QFZ41319.1 putative mitochondrial 37S ribosomal protein [Clavispora lusitaniae]
MSLLKRISLIKFVGGPHSHAAVSGAAKPHPCSPSGKLPALSKSASSYVSKPIELKEGEVLLRSELSKRFRYTPLKAEEEEQITSGGAELVF